MIFWSTATHPKSTSITRKLLEEAIKEYGVLLSPKKCFLVPEEEYVDNVRKGIPSPRRSSNASTS
jgi:hypothetical protein